MKQRSKSTLFLIEQIIVIAVFAVCAAACVRILAASYFISQESKDLSNAVLAAQSAAESYKAVGGDLEKVARILNSPNLHGTDLVVFYNGEWIQTQEPDSAAYALRLVSDSSTHGANTLAIGELTVEKVSGEQILSITVAANTGRVSG